MQQVVATRRGDLERPPRPRLPAHLRQVGAGALVPGRGSGTARRLGAAPQDLDRMAEVARSDDLDAAAEARLGSALAPRRPAPRPQPAGPPRPSPGRPARAAGARRGRAPPPLRRGLDPLGRRLARHREHGKGDREVESGSLLALLGRRQVDREPRPREAELRRRDAAPDPLAGLLDGPIGEPDDDEARHAVDQVRLDLDAPRRDPHEPERERSRNHPDRAYASTCNRGASAGHDRGPDRLRRPPGSA